MPYYGDLIMKTIILIIFMRGWSGEAVAVDHVEFNTMDSCNKAVQELLIMRKTVKTMQYLSATYTCVEK